MSRNQDSTVTVVVKIIFIISFVIATAELKRRLVEVQDTVFKISLE
ncbi:MAG: hypothetical protein ACXV76_11545 [Halobacteriota archaeon]